jgi:hypothetical protein
MLASVDIEPAHAELAPPARRGVTIVPHGGGAIRIGPGSVANAPRKE